MSTGWGSNRVCVGGYQGTGGLKWGVVIASLRDGLVVVVGGGLQCFDGGLQCFDGEMAYHRSVDGGSTYTEGCLSAKVTGMGGPGRNTRYGGGELLRSGKYLQGDGGGGVCFHFC